MLRILPNPLSLVLVRRPNNASVWSSGLLRSCVLPLQLELTANGALVVRDRTGTMVWGSQSACSSTVPGCYSYSLRVRAGRGHAEGVPLRMHAMVAACIVSCTVAWAVGCMHDARGVAVHSSSHMASTAGSLLRDHMLARLQQPNSCSWKRCGLP